MNDKARAYLWDARDAIDAIQTFVAGVDLDEYAMNPMLHSAVERKYEIIARRSISYRRSTPRWPAAFLSFLRSSLFEIN